MKPLRILLLSALLIPAVSALGQGAKSVAVLTAPQAQASQSAPTLASAIDREISAVEKQVLEAAEAMPEEKFNFSPESLNLPGSNYKGVRTFAVQVKHIAASNYFIWSGLTGDKLPENLKDGNGPEDVRTKAEILVPEGFFCPGSQGRGYVDPREHAADARAQQVDPPAPGHIWRRTRLQSLRTDGGVFADERNCAARQPGKVRLMSRPPSDARWHRSQAPLACARSLPILAA
jgi:hypothetical protein